MKRKEKKTKKEKDRNILHMISSNFTYQFSKFIDSAVEAIGRMEGNMIQATCPSRCDYNCRSGIQDRH